MVAARCEESQNPQSASTGFNEGFHLATKLPTTTRLANTQTRSIPSTGSHCLYSDWPTCNYITLFIFALYIHNQSARIIISSQGSDGRDGRDGRLELGTAVWT